MIQEMTSFQKDVISWIIKLSEIMSVNLNGIIFDV